MIDIHHVVHPSGGGRRKHRGVVDCCCDDAGTDPAPAQAQSKDGSLTRVYPGCGENDLIRSRSDGSGHHFSSLVHGLGGEPAGPVETSWIAPPCLLPIKPSLARIGEHWLARRGVQEDLGNEMRHASKLARESSSRAAMLQGEPPENSTHTPVMTASSYVRVNSKERVAAASVGGHESSVCTDPTKGATWVAGLNGPLWMT
jgi:hypothetical protein